MNHEIVCFLICFELNVLFFYIFQAQKPMLKYSNNAIKPVQLFNHADLMSIRSNAEAARNAYSSLSQASSSSTMSTPFRSSVKPTPSPQATAQAAGMYMQDEKMHKI